MLINLLVWIIVGGIAGWLASLLVRGGGMGVIGDVIVGIVVAFIGAVILLFIVKLFTGRHAVS